MFYIRADANNEIATGHVMRCMSIADEMKKRGSKICFLTADHNADELIHSRGFKTECLNSDWNNLENELETGKIVHILESDSDLEGILVDTYYVTERYLEVLHKICKTIYIDDLFVLNKYSVDFLINYNIYGSDLDYKSRCLSETKLLLGTKYVPLRAQFKDIRPKFRCDVKNIFISTGGADNFNIAGLILDRLLEKSNLKDFSALKKINYHVISGVMNKNLPYLLEIEKAHNNVFIHENVLNIAEIMTMCDIAVSACGSTMYELCACGLPIITYSVADNQLQGVKKFDEIGVAVNCGDVREDFYSVICKIADKVFEMCIDILKRKKCMKVSSDLVDSYGIFRIIQMLK